MINNENEWWTLDDETGSVLWQSVHTSPDMVQIKVLRCPDPIRLGNYSAHFFGFDRRHGPNIFNIPDTDWWVSLDWCDPTYGFKVRFDKKKESAPVDHTKPQVFSTTRTVVDVIAMVPMSPLELESIIRLCGEGGTIWPKLMEAKALVEREIAYHEGGESS